MSEQSSPKYLSAYKPTNFTLTHVRLHITVDPAATEITTWMKFELRRGFEPTLALDGEDIELVSISLDGKILTARDYVLAGNQLLIADCPAGPFELQITQRCNPSANTALSGLYLSNGVFCTQMEAEGFRRMAFTYDRPDIMAIYDVRIEAPLSLPVLLSNGNLVEAGHLPGSERHFAIWHDPHPKPSYLFAMVAGDLACLKDQFLTGNGNSVELAIYVEHGKQDRCAWAMACLKASMKWDEEKFGRFYDLDIFNIVAVSDFNMGAMENKGLNIFNDKYVLATAASATDADYANIERIIAHEYFHNWTGNRITCRDWFQLCLKEGLTVFRDQEFTGDMRSRAVKRIEDVKTLRARQFPEDQGPLAHPVRPEKYIEINNFYTATIYEKGAEICRMLHTLLGETLFRKAMDLYFERHDGQAATVEDFIACMADVSGRNLTQFMLWYSQAGTPVISVSSSYEASSNKLNIEFTQHTPPTPEQIVKHPLHIPLRIALLFPRTGKSEEHLIELITASQSFSFASMAEEPLLSINRNFSAPIVLQLKATPENMLQQLALDTDPFNQWEAGQAFVRELFRSTYFKRDYARGAAALSKALAEVLASPMRDDAFKALMLQFPSEAEFTALIGQDVDADNICAARRQVMASLSQHLRPELLNILNLPTLNSTYAPDAASAGWRSLRYAALALFAYASPDEAMQLAQREVNNPANMTVENGALAAMLGAQVPGSTALLSAYFDRHQEDKLLVDKWFLLQGCFAENDADAIRDLLRHPKFTFTTPNRVYALLGGFTGSNLKAFHAANGSGYQLMADCVITLNKLNPQVAARMATSFRNWRQYDETRKASALLEMQRILATPALSADVYEIITRTLSG